MSSFLLPRECFAISPGVQAINSSSNDVFLESFLLHFCALGSQMNPLSVGFGARLIAVP